MLPKIPYSKLTDFMQGSFLINLINKIFDGNEKIHQ